MSTEESADGTQSTATLAVWRLVVGALQGAALYFLYHASDTHLWPATDGLTFAPLLFIALFIPLGLSLSFGNLRATTLSIWAAAAALAIANVAYYGIWKLAPEWQQVSPDHFALNPQIVPAFGVFFFTSVWLFIAHVLISGGDTDRRVVAIYHTHFDIGWKLAVQLALSAAFVGMFWAMLLLGADLFELINLHFLKKLIEHQWFSIPATALAVAVAVHLTDARAGLVRGFRTLVLVLLGWFLPLLTVLVVGFLVALLFTGLEPLWQTRYASASLLAAAGALVILINAAYQFGDESHSPQRVLRYAGSIAAITLVPLVALAAYALYLRVEEYGWTADRVAMQACIAVAACYAVGYASAAVFSAMWMQRIERWNFVSAIVILVVLTALFSPIADPDRIAVQSQVPRLLSSKIATDKIDSGRIASNKFDFDYLRWHSGRYGVEALEEIAASDKYASAVRAKARELLAKKTSYQLPPKAQGPDIEANVTVYPRGASLPADFSRQNWNDPASAELYPACLRRRGMSCEAFVLSLEQSGGTDIVVLNDSAQDTIFEKDPDGVWRAAGRPGPLWTCASVLNALRAGQIAFAPPTQPRWRDVTVEGVSLTVLPPDDRTPSCPK